MAPHSLQHYVPFISTWPCMTSLPNVNAAFCNRFLHLCMYHPVCMCVRVCVFGQVVWFEFVRTSQQLNAAFCNQFLHLCMYHPVCMCVRVCVFGQVVWFEFVRTSQQLNAPLCNQFLHLCMYHQVCMCVCVSSARLCDLSLSDLVSN